MGKKRVVMCSINVFFYNWPQLTLFYIRLGGFSLFKNEGKMKILAVLGLMTLLALFIGGQTLATEYKIKVGSPLSLSKILSGEIGERIEVTLTFQQLDAIGSNGLAIILPSSTTN